MTVAISVVGLGPWGQTLANKLAGLPEFALKSTFDRRGSRKIDAAEPAASLDAVLDNPEIEAVVIATPNASHLPLALRALDAGKHVLVAKPLAPTAAECDQILRLAREKNLIAVTGHTTLFNPGVLLMRDLIAELDRPVLHFDARRRGVGRIQQNSVLLDLAVHDLANAIFLTGQTPVAAHHIARQYGDCAAAQAQMFLKFDGGASAHVESSWIASERRRVATVTLDGFLIELDELASKVSVYEATPTAKLATDNFGAKKIAEHHVAAADALADELKSFGGLIGGRNFAEENARIARAVVEAIEISTELPLFS